MTEEHVGVTFSDSPPDDAVASGFAVSHPSQDVCVVEVGCDLDMMTVPSLEGLLTRALTAGYRGVLVELSGCDFMASAGLAVLMAARSQAMELGTRFGLVGINRVVGRALEATGLESLLTNYPSVDAAVGSLEPGDSTDRRDEL